MVLFVSISLGLKIIPMSRVYSITNLGRHISINYDEGCLVYADEEHLVKRVESVKVTYDTVEEALETMRSFYRSLEKKSEVFKF